MTITNHFYFIAISQHLEPRSLPRLNALFSIHDNLRKIPPWPMAARHTKFVPNCKDWVADWHTDSMDDLSGSVPESLTRLQAHQIDNI